MLVNVRPAQIPTCFLVVYIIFPRKTIDIPSIIVVLYPSLLHNIVTTNIAIGGDIPLYPYYSW